MADDMLLIPKADLVAGYDAIRAKGVPGLIKSGEMAGKIASIPTGKPEQETDSTITENGDWVINPDPGYTISKAKVKVAVAGGGELPKLSSPASAEDIASGKQAYNSRKEVVTGRGDLFNAADINHDGIVDIFDMSVLLTNYNKNGVGIPGDLDGNGVVNVKDLGLMSKNYNKSNRKKDLLTCDPFAEIPTISWTQTEVRPDGGEGTPAIYKLVGHVKSAHGVKSLLTALNFDNTVIQPVSSWNASGKGGPAEFADVSIINEDKDTAAGAMAYVLYPVLKDNSGRDPIPYSISGTTYKKDNRSSVEFTQFAAEIPDSAIDTDYLEFYFRLADGKTWADVNKSTFQFASLAGDGVVSFAILDAKNGFFPYYANPYGPPGDNLTITYPNSTVPLTRKE